MEAVDGQTSVAVDGNLACSPEVEGNGGEMGEARDHSTAGAVRCSLGGSRVGADMALVDMSALWEAHPAKKTKRDSLNA